MRREEAESTLVASGGLIALLYILWVWEIKRMDLKFGLSITYVASYEVTNHARCAVGIVVDFWGDSRGKLILVE